MFYFLLLVLSTLLGLTNSAYAATYWVAENGSNSNTCAQAQKQSTPKLTIAAGNACLSAGDTLMVKAGTYNEGLVNAKGGGSEGGRITYKSETPLGAVLVPPQDEGVVWQTGQNYATFDGFVIDANRTHYGFGVQGTHIRIMNTEVKNSQREGVTSSTTDGAGNGSIFLELINLHVHHNGLDRDACTDTGNGQFTGECHGAYLSASDTLIDGGSWHDNQSYGIHLYRCPNNIIVRNARIYDNGFLFPGWGGVGIGGFCANNHQYYNNVIYNNRVAGIWAAATNTLIYNNTVVNNPSTGILNGSGSTIARNNIVYSNGQNISGDDIGKWSNNLTTNPSFVNASAGDFHLQSGSAAINAGQGVSEVTADCDGILRPQGPGYDIGAYEYSVGPLPPPPNFRIVSH